MTWKLFISFLLSISLASAMRGLVSQTSVQKRCLMRPKSFIRNNPLNMVMSELDNKSVAAADNELSTKVLDQRSVTWTAKVTSSVWVKELKRTAKAYMALPASEYSVLSADQIERLSDSQFKAVLGKLNFFGTVIIPVLYVDVHVVPDEHRAEINVKRAETIGSEMAEKVSGTFQISAVNLVSAGADDKGRPTLTSDTSLSINVVVPEDSRVPVRLIQSGGNFIIQSSLNLIVPTFVRLLAMDFKRWSAGDDKRSAVDGASLSV